MKSERMAKRASFGNMVLKKLSDITNIQNVKIATEIKPPEISYIDKDYVDQLIKERRNLLKLIAERNHIIELTGAELQKLRVNLQKLQLQNWNLAQSNSQMIAEVNHRRERVKALQHELVCKEALLKANSFRNKGKTTMNCEKTVPQEGDETNEAEIPRSQNKRRIVRSRSMGASITTRSQKAEDKEQVENKRRCLKRQSARFKKEQSDNYFEIEDTKFAVDEKNKSNYNETNNIEEEEEEEMGVRGRSSIGRPLRRAAGKIQSYKEVPINIKMRRER